MPPLQPRQQISRRNLNASMEQGRRQANMRGGPGTRFSNTPAGIQIDSPDDWIWAKLTAAPGGAGQGYAWQEVIEDGTGGQIALPDGYSGTTTKLQAFPWNGLNVPLTGPDGQPTVVQMFFADNSETMLFNPGGAGGQTLIRIMGLPVQLTGTSYWYYPGVVYKPFDPGTLWTGTPTTLTIDPNTINGVTPSVSVAINCWLVSWYTYIDAIGTAGDSACFAASAGKSYDPVPVGVDAPRTYTLPVYYTDHYAAFVAVQCNLTMAGPDVVGLYGG